MHVPVHIMIIIKIPIHLRRVRRKEADRIDVEENPKILVLVTVIMTVIAREGVAVVHEVVRVLVVNANIVRHTKNLPMMTGTEIVAIEIVVANQKNHISRQRLHHAINIVDRTAIQAPEIIITVSDRGPVHLIKIVESTIDHYSDLYFKISFAFCSNSK